MSYALSSPSASRRSGLLTVVIGLHAAVIAIVIAAKTVVPQIMEMPLIVDLVQPAEIKPPEAKPLPVTKPQPVFQKPQTRPTPTPVIEATQSQVATANAPVASPPDVKPAPPAPPKVDGQALESGYLKGLRNELDTYKQYPTGRQASLERPSGEVVVWLMVDRQGRVLDAGIQTPAPSMLLNRAATNSLRRIKQVKPFPEQAFGGRNEQRFTATFNYSVQ